MTSQRLFHVIDLVAKHVPERLARAGFSAIGTIVGWSNIAGVRQLRANYQRCAPVSSWKNRRRSAAGMRHYLRYFYEAFRLPYLTAEQIDARVRVDNVEALQQALAEDSCAAALMHMGNWDLAGAWATRHLAPVHTVAEKLRPPEVAEIFLKLRRDLGMTIYHAEKSQHVISNLQRDMTTSHCFVPVLCDRDLSATGVEVLLWGHPARIAPGPAILAQQTQRPMFPVLCVAENFAHDRQRVAQAGTVWGIRLIIGPAISSQVSPSAPWAERQADVTAMMTQWADYVSETGAKYLLHWHMLQKVFTEDLDPQRLRQHNQEEL